MYLTRDILADAHRLSRNKAGVGQGPKPQSDKKAAAKHS